MIYVANARPKLDKTAVYARLSEWASEGYNLNVNLSSLAVLPQLNHCMLIILINYSTGRPCKNANLINQRTFSLPLPTSLPLSHKKLQSFFSLFVRYSYCNFIDVLRTKQRDELKFISEFIVKLSFVTLVFFLFLSKNAEHRKAKLGSWAAKIEIYPIITPQL